MAWNDPQWGNRNSGGPPDLDELWRKFNQRLNAMFGRRGGGGPASPGGGGAGDFHLPGGAGLIVALLVVIWLASGFYIVDAGERGVVLRFGKYVETTLPGPRWHLPYPIEHAEIVNVDQVRNVEIGYRQNVKSKVLSESLMLTDDENIIDLQFSVQYTVRDPVAYLFNNRFTSGTVGVDAANEVVKQVAESAMREIVGKSKMDFALYEGRETVAAGADKLMQKILDRYKTGISISKVNMQNAQPPEQVQAAFDDANKANQDKQRLINEGQAYANDVIPRASGVAARLQEEARGYKQRVIADAEGDASRFKQILVQYERAPRVTRERLYQDTMQQVLSGTTKVLIDEKRGGNLLYLPLDKLMQMTGTAAGTPTATGSAAENQSSTSDKPSTPSTGSSSSSNSDDLFRSRDAFRSRNREERP